MIVRFVLFHGAENRTANPQRMSLPCHDVDDLFDVLLGDRVGADDAAVEGLVELEVFPATFLHVNNVNRRGPWD